MKNPVRQDSVLSHKQEVTNEQWVVGLLRKPHSKNSHHVLMAVEGRNSFGQAILRRYDLVIDNEKAVDEKTKCPYSKIVIQPDRFCASADAKAQLEDLIRGEEYYVKAWTLSVDQAQTLHSNIQTTQTNPPLYLQSGDLSSFNASNSRSEKIKGHSCYTWARAELKKIGLKDVPKSPLDRIMAVPDFVIRPEGSAQESGTGVTCRLM